MKTTTISFKISKSKTDYQKFVIRNLYRMFKSESRVLLSIPGIKSEIIDSMVRHYPEITRIGQITYKKLQLYHKHFRWSNGAALPNFPHTHKDVHTEHIVPVNDCMNRLYALKNDFTMRELLKVFDDYKTER